MNLFLTFAAAINSMVAFAIGKILQKLPGGHKPPPQTKPLLLLPILGIIQVLVAASLYFGYQFVTRADNLSTELFRASFCGLIFCIGLAGYVQQLSLRMHYATKNAPKRRKSR